MKPTVVVLLASFNGERYLSEQIRSILYQTGVIVQLFVGDDGSTDGTATLLAQLAREHANLTILNSRLPSGSAAANFMSMLSTVAFDDAAFVALADQDDIWQTGKLARAVAQLEQNGASGYSSDLIAFSNETARVSYLKKSYPQKRLDYLFQGGSAGCTYVLTRPLAQFIGRRCANLQAAQLGAASHDWLIYALARSAGYKWVCDEYAGIFYRQHARNVYGYKGKLRDALGKLRLLRGGWYRRNILWIAARLEDDPVARELTQRLTRYGWRDRWYLLGRVTQMRRETGHVRVMALMILFGLV